MLPWTRETVVWFVRCVWTLPVVGLAPTHWLYKSYTWTAQQYIVVPNPGTGSPSFGCTTRWASTCPHVLEGRCLFRSVETHLGPKVEPHHRSLIVTCHWCPWCHWCPQCAARASPGPCGPFLTPTTAT
ncbi:hypothetical protein BD289DRAFT_184519 [Coniella lustricola]|uniref:Uncharacterized protein n=1 Tax=Coniella lustricola TaxID=2025994 RepID=A0A2T3ADA2_9PEZI|nr:hypothetical protein BD289DRAFT_184519 [Coniella lustricola]